MQVLGSFCPQEKLASEQLKTVLLYMMLNGTKSVNSQPVGNHKVDSHRTGSLIILDSCHTAQYLHKLNKVVGQHKYTNGSGHGTGSELTQNGQNHGMGSELTQSGQNHGTRSELTQTGQGPRARSVLTKGGQSQGTGSVPTQSGQSQGTGSELLQGGQL